MLSDVPERLYAEVIAHDIELTGHFESPPLQHGVIAGMEVVAGVPDPTLPVLVPTPGPAASGTPIGEPIWNLLGESATVRIPRATEPVASEPPPSAMGPGFLCETCWDQPATQVLPAPWGGEMGICVWCAKGEGEEKGAEGLPSITPFEEAHTLAQTLLDDVMASTARSQSVHPFAPPQDVYQFSPDGQTWYAQITDCVSGVRFIRNNWVMVHVSSSIA